MGSFLLSRGLLPALLQGNPEHVTDYILNFNRIVKLQIENIFCKTSANRMFSIFYGASSIITLFKTNISGRILVKTDSIGI
jgi:hypothetical protein